MIEGTIIVTATLGILSSTVIGAADTLEQFFVEAIPIPVADAIGPVTGTIIRAHSKTLVQSDAEIEVLVLTRAVRIDSNAFTDWTFRCWAGVCVAVVG